MLLTNNLAVELANPAYVPVIKDNVTFYGGSQMWFSVKNWYSKDYILHHYGCGTIAAADMFLYLALQKDDMNNPDTVIAFQNSDQIRYENYIIYVRHIHNIYTRTHRYLAVLGPKLASAVSLYSDFHNLGLEASWKWKLSYYDMYDLLEDMLEHDFPVILSIGPNTPNLWGKKGITLFEKKEIAYMEPVPNNTEQKEKRKPYYYKPSCLDLSGHYVTVTGLIKDDVANKIMLRISSWGRLYYIDYEEYRDYIDNFGGTYTSSIVYIRNDSLSYYMK